MDLQTPLEQSSRPIHEPIYTNHLILTSSPSRPRILIDEDFKLQELHLTLYSFRRRSFSGLGHLTYKALKCLGASMRPRLLATYNEVWCTVDIPISWRSSVVILVHKPGNPVQDIGSFCQILLTSHLGNLMEKIMNPRLFWSFDSSGVLPEVI